MLTVAVIEYSKLKSHRVNLEAILGESTEPKLCMQKLMVAAPLFNGVHQVIYNNILLFFSKGPETSAGSGEQNFGTCISNSLAVASWKLCFGLLLLAHIFFLSVCWYAS